MLKIKKLKWNDAASPLTHFKIYRYIGPTILGKQADVELIYKNGKSVKIYGDEKEVADEAARRILHKKNPEGKYTLIKDFVKSWQTATILGYSEYKKRTGNKNPIETLDPLNVKKPIDSLNKIKAVNELLKDSFYKQINPAKLIQSKLSEKGWDTKTLADKMQKLGKDHRQKQTTTYTHLSGEREVSRDVAIEYAKILNCDAVDLMFPKKTSIIWGKVNTKKPIETYKPFVPGEIYSYTASDKDLETAIVPRDIWKKNIKAIKIEARGTMFDQQVAFYYFSNAKDTSCMNKLCVVGANVQPSIQEPDYLETNYYLGIYENDKGVSNLISADPFVGDKNKYILKNFEPTFISPVVCVVNPQMIIDETAKQSVVPETAYRYEEMLRAELNKAREELIKIKQVAEKTDKVQQLTERTQKEADEIRRRTKQTQAEAQKIYESVKKLQESLLKAEQGTVNEEIPDFLKDPIPYVNMDDEDKVA